jgi:exopolyphosphatase/guanosine-5'-triphosphate,3'-diphosphate pyrophosphatase
MRVAVIDIGTNSTRLLIADVIDADAIAEVERQTKVTRLGDGVDHTGVLSTEAMDRVLATVARYLEIIRAHGAPTTVAVLTSAVRDAANGAAFTARLRAECGLDARTIPGDEEARLTFLGATSQRHDFGTAPTAVIDIGGGSTEFVIGRGREVSFHVSTQAGVVRQTERHLPSDPPEPNELHTLAAEIRGIVGLAIPDAARRPVQHAIAVAGTATSCAAIDQALEPYDAARVEGHVLSVASLREILGRLAGMTVEERRSVPGLHPDRAPTIVAGVVILIEVLDCLGLGSVEVSEHDILRGAAIVRARTPHATP